MAPNEPESLGAFALSQGSCLTSQTLPVRGVSCVNRNPEQEAPKYPVGVMLHVTEMLTCKPILAVHPTTMRADGVLHKLHKRT